MGKRIINRPDKNFKVMYKSIIRNNILYFIVHGREKSLSFRIKIKP